MDSAVTTARHTEAVKNQQAELRSDNSSSVETVHKREEKGSTTQPQSSCTRCRTVTTTQFQTTSSSEQNLPEVQETRTLKLPHMLLHPPSISSKRMILTFYGKRRNQWKVTLQLDGQPIEFRCLRDNHPKEMYMGSAHGLLRKAYSSPNSVAPISAPCR